MESCVLVGMIWNTLITGENTQNLVELREVEEVGSVSMYQGAEGQAILPASAANRQRQPTSQFRREIYAAKFQQ